MAANGYFNMYRIWEGKEKGAMWDGRAVLQRQFGARKLYAEGCRLRGREFGPALHMADAWGLSGAWRLYLLVKNGYRKANLLNLLSLKIPNPDLCR